MQLKNLKNFDSSIEFITDSMPELNVLGITDSSELKNNHLYFAKNKKFLEPFMAQEDRELGLILEKKFFDLLSAEDVNKIKEKALWLATSADVNLTMSFLSRPFYDEIIGNPNDVIDGRQMGSASVHPTAWIAQGAHLGENVTIGANVKIHSGVRILSGVSIDENTELFPNVTIYRNVKIGKNVRIHANTTVGADGFGYNFARGIHHKVWHMGSVVISDDVEIGANSAIDSGTFSPTVIGPGTKIDNLVQIGHNCKLGRGVIACGQVGIGGSTSIGDYTVIGGDAKIANGLKIGAQVQIAGGSGVTGDVGDKEVVGGFPARDIKEWMKGVAYVRRMSLGDKK